MKFLVATIDFWNFEFCLQKGIRNGFVILRTNVVRYCNPFVSSFYKIKQHTRMRLYDGDYKRIG